MKNLVITIGRQYGSGGREIGRLVAQELGIPFFDKELITASVKESGLDAKIFEEMEERATQSFLYSLAVGSFTPTILADTTMDYFSLNDRVNAIQANTMKRLAGESHCVIVGRAADDILAGFADCLNVFVHADLEVRIKRVTEEYGVKGDDDDVEDIVVKTDKRRANYYNYISGKKWSAAENYHLALDSERLGIAGCVELITATALRLRPDVKGDNSK